MNIPDPIPPGQFGEEVRLIRRLVENPPWRHSREGADGARSEDVDRGLRATYRRWSSVDEVPSPEMMAPLWARVPKDPQGFAESDTERAVHHAALVLHLLALGADEGPEASNFGAACAHRSADSKGPLISEGRFARLVNTPAPGRLEAVGRTFRRFRQGGVRWSTADLENLLRFLFTDDYKRAVSHWAAGYYRSDAPEETSAELQPVEA